MGEGNAAHTGAMPKRGLLTFKAEGQEGGRFHSRKLHVPTASSGATLGRGYDMKEKRAVVIEQDLVRAGIPLQTAQKIAKLAGLKGKAAEKAIDELELRDFEISSDVQLRLFKIAHEWHEADVKRICTKADVVEIYGKTEWSKLDPAIKEVLIDLRFRGDYTPESRRLLQKLVSKNDFDAFVEALSDPENWTNVPSDRFKRRAAFLKAAQDERKKGSKPAGAGGTAPVGNHIRLP